MHHQHHKRTHHQLPGLSNGSVDSLDRGVKILLAEQLGRTCVENLVLVLTPALNVCIFNIYSPLLLAFVPLIRFQSLPVSAASFEILSANTVFSWSF